MSSASPNSTLSTIISFPWDDDTDFGILLLYTESESRGMIALIVASCISLVATVGLLCAIAMSAFNTRGIKNRDMFVRTHIAFYFVSLLLGDILQSIGSIMNAAWVHEKAVFFGSFCVAQGVIKHTADVAIALWSLVIAIRTFVDIFLRVEVEDYMMWLVMISQWSTIGAIILVGPAAATLEKQGPFYGISNDWCWITSNYQVERIVLDYMVMFISALFAFILYSLVYLRLRGMVRAQTPSTSMNQERNEKYEHRLARQMLLFPIAYTIMIIPITTCRFLRWSGYRVPLSATIFSDFIYLLSGLVHVILFASLRRILPPRSMLPRFLIISSMPALASAVAVEKEHEGYYGDTTTKQSNCDDAEKGTYGASLLPCGVTKLAEDPDEPFAYPALPPSDVTIIKRVHSPDSDSEIGSANSPHNTLSRMPTDYVDQSLLSEKASSPDPARAQDEARSEHEQHAVGPTPQKLRADEEVEVPASETSIIELYES